jgi:hypothetical protein
MILKRFSIWDRLFAVLLVASSLFYFWGLKAVPFHPDEGTQLFMSADFEALLTRPLTLVWQPGEDGDLRQRYRLLDAPLTRYLIGAGRMATGQPALVMDWDWSLGWKENSMAGAVPTPSQLDAARFAVASLFPLTLLFTYLTGKALVGGPAGLLAALLTATNALILLHTRRAMAESWRWLSTPNNRPQGCSRQASLRWPGPRPLRKIGFVGPVSAGRDFWAFSFW